MKKKNLNIIREVKKFVSNSEEESLQNNTQTKNNDSNSSPISQKKYIVDKTIEKEINKWIENKAEITAKRIISDAVKKIFK